MPYVNIKVTREGTSPGATNTTPAQKAALIKGVSDLLFEILGKAHESTFVVIDEVELEDWGWVASPSATTEKSWRPDMSMRATRADVSPSRQAHATDLRNLNEVMTIATLVCGRLFSIRFEFSQALGDYELIAGISPSS